MGYNKMDRINALAVLRLNNGNKLQTAQELGLDRKTLMKWEKQMESDLKMLDQVEAAVGNFAKIEELTALKASAELNRRLDITPHEIKDGDLLRIKDSGVNNSRLMRGEATHIVAQQARPEDHALEFFKILLAEMPFHEALAALRQASLAPLVSNYTRDLVADRIQNNPKLLEG